MYFVHILTLHICKKKNKFMNFEELKCHFVIDFNGEVVKKSDFSKNTFFFLNIFMTSNA